MALNIIFMGTPAFAVPVLDAVVRAGHHVVGVYSQPPRRSGRGMGTRKSPVQERADALGLAVRTPLNFRIKADQEEIRLLNADAAVVVAYGLILPQAVLDAPKLGCFNVHASKLPRWRGAAPIQRAIMAGDPTTGVGIMRMDAGLDTGPVCLARDVPIEAHVTAGELSETLSRLGAGLMVEALARIEARQVTCVSQPAAGVTYATKIDKAEARIDFDKPAKVVVDHIRGLSPFPGAWFEIDLGGARERIKVLRAVVVPGDGQPGTVLDGEMTIACAQEAMRIEILQRAGKQPMSAQAFLRGARVEAGTRLI